eukprot:jgi/Orpsp1_1/1186461/evm.model.d7180000050747.1
MIKFAYATDFQSKIYFSYLKEDDKLKFIINKRYNLSSKVEVEKLKKCFNLIYQKYDILKTCFKVREENGESKVIVIKRDDSLFTFENYTSENEDGLIRPYNLSEAPLFRIGFIENKVLLLSCHRIILNDFSINSIIHELVSLYNGNNTLEVPIQFHDFIENEKKLNFQYVNDHIDYLNEMFHCEHHSLILPRKNKFYQNSSKSLKTISIDIGVDNYAKVKEFLNSKGLIHEIYFISMYSYIMKKYSNQENIYTSLLNSSGNKSSEKIVGPFVNIYPFLVKFNENNKLEDIYNQVYNHLLNYENRKFSIEDINSINSVKLNNCVVYTSDNSEDDSLKSVLEEQNQDFNAKMDEDCTFLSKIYDFDFIMEITEKNDNLMISMNFNDQEYDENLLNDILESYKLVLIHPDNFCKTMDDIEYIPLERKNKILYEFNNNRYEYKYEKLYHELFSEISSQNSEKCAIIFDDQEITFGQIERMSNSLAHYLRSHGVRRNEIIPIISERSYLFVVMVIAVMKAGGAFLLIDTDLPEDRVKYLVYAIRSKMVLKYLPNNSNNLKKKLFDQTNITEYDVEDHDFNENTSKLPNVNSIEDLCCIFFTSGSTGKPKGIMITHENFFNYCYCATLKNNKCFLKDEFDSIISFAKVSYIILVTEIFYSLLRFIKVILCDDNEYNNPHLLGKLIKKYSINGLIGISSRIKNYMNDENFREALSIIKIFVFVGEMVTVDFLQLLIKYTNGYIYNAYGLTETTACGIIKLIEHKDIIDGKFLTIGTPMCNSIAYILDKNLKPIPIGVEGDIYLSGDSICKGYLGQPELTKEIFIDCPYSNRKMFKTGDLGKWMYNGEICHLGRSDYQIKIRGQRIELGEIENVMRKIKNINHAIVIDKLNSKGEKYLVGYYISNDETINDTFIKDFLIKNLPLFMIPNYFIKIDKIPLNVNGKLDRKKLPEPNISEIIGKSDQEVVNAYEKKLCQIFEEVLNLSYKISVKNNIFELGVNSLTAIKIKNKIEKEFHIKLNLKDIFIYSSLFELSNYIENKTKSPADNETNNKEVIITRKNIKEFPITSQQLGVYIDSIKNPNSIIYNIPMSFNLKKGIDIEKIKEGIKALIKKQEILKSKYIEKEINGQSEIVGIIDDDMKIEFENYTYDNIKEFVRPFQLSEGPLIRIGFINDEVLLVDMHHIISDGASFSILIEEISKYYNNSSDISDLEIQYNDYAYYINDKKKSDEYEKLIQFYKEMFNVDYDNVNIPLKNSENEDDENVNEIENENMNMKSIVDKCEIHIDECMSKIINDFITSNGISKTAFFITIYGYILSKYSGQDSIYTSIMTANRNIHYIENMLGMFVTTQPLLLNYSECNIKFTDMIKNNMSIIMELYKRQDFSFSQLSNSLKLKPVNNSFIFQPNMPIKFNSFESILSEENNNLYNSLYQKSNELEKNNISKFDITFNVIENEKDYSINIEYNSNLYGKKTIQNMLNSFIEIVSHIKKLNEDIPEVEYIPNTEKEIILKSFNDNKFKYDESKIYHEEFSKIAKMNPNKIAIIYNNINISYKTLDEMTNSLAFYLRSQNIGRNDIIPILCGRSPEYIISMLAVSKAGGAFLPINVKLPIDRITYILNEVHPKLILYYDTNNAIENIKSNISYKIYEIKNHDFNANKDDIQSINENNDLCYVLFTSGTTGNPKGVLISHFNLYNNIGLFEDDKEMNNNNLCLSNLLRNDKVSRALAITNFTFDISHSEITLSLINGLTIVLVDEKIGENISLLSDYIYENEVDFINTTPSRFKIFLENDKFRNTLKQIKSVVLLGEELSIDLCRNINKYSKCKIYNGYGPTECTVTASYKEVDINENRRTATIGRPQCNYNIYILDQNIKPVPIGTEGEIYIGGYGVGKGYLNRDELTKERFIECPFTLDDNDVHNKIMYKTGDLGKWTEDGEIEYLGRIDFQVKINGQRVELGEIESNINEIEEIKYSIVIDKEKENGEKYLVCYYKSDENVNGRNIRNYLKKKLPSYMIPNYYVKIDKIPLSSTGKLNRKELPTPNLDELIQEEYVAPINDIEKTICKIYGEIFKLEVGKISRNSDFYELGGDSLNAIRIISKIEKEFKLKFSMKDIDTYPIIYELSNHIQNIITNGNEENKLIVIEKRNMKEFPITSQQLGVYIDSIKNPNSIIYNIPISFNIKKGTDISKIKEGFNKIIEKQEILKSKYIKKEIDGKSEIVGIIDDNMKIEFEYYTYDNVEKFVRPFQLSEGPLIRIGFINDEVLLIDMHHIISDGASIFILIEEITKYYNNSNDISDLEIQFSDYAYYINDKMKTDEYEKQIQFYKEMFNAEYDIVNISKKNNGNEDKNEKMSTKNFVNNCEVNINENMSKLINEFITSNNISKTAFFITIYGYILSKYSGQDSIYTSIMTANRNIHYVQNMLGMFVTTQPLLLNYSECNIKFTDMIKTNMNIIMELYKRQDFSISQISNSLKLKPINNAFIFQPNTTNQINSENNIIFNNNNNNNKIYSLYDCFNELNENKISKFDITFNVIENENDYFINIEYNSNLYEKKTIQNMLNSFIEIVSHIKKLNEDIPEVEYIPNTEKEIILKSFNDNKFKYDESKIYHEEFSKIAKMNPNKIAIIYNNIKISYKTLDEMTNSLAFYLRSQNIGRNDIVPILCDRSPEFIISMLAVSKAGGAFLPIDINLPIDRITYILNEVNPKLILYYDIDNAIENIKSNISYRIYEIKNHDFNANKDDIQSINENNDLCYVLFTSGTTGNPKGVLISHFNLYSNIGIFKDDKEINNNNLCLSNLLRNDKVSRALAITNFTFDISHNEIALSLINELTIVLVDEKIGENISLLSDYIYENEVDFINTTPSRFKIFLENDKFKNILKQIKSTVFIGEELSIDLCRNINKYSKCKIYNGYGPTECTVTASYKEVDITENKITSNIGKPQCNYNIYILDKYLKPVPIGTEGEIYIGGYGVGKGYLNRDDLTKEKFIECPFTLNDNDVHNKIMYKTGDLGKWTEDGEIEYLGRIDFQVKINGQRVELGEIESNINEIEEIKYSVVIDKEKENGEKYLVCYYISDENVNGRNIRNYLKKKLPSYMIPNYYIKIDKIPLSSTGKLNRKELPTPNLDEIIQEEYVAPINDIEKTICKIYGEIFKLEVGKISRNSDFYELGGDSLNAIRIISKIEKEFKLKF